jgi:hypothetical protein
MAAAWLSALSSKNPTTAERRTAHNSDIEIFIEAPHSPLPSKSAP